MTLWDDLLHVPCPTLILCGGLPAARLGAEGMRRYVNQLANVRIVVFRRSGHRVWEPDHDRFIATIDRFLSSLDP